VCGHFHLVCIYVRVYSSSATGPWAVNEIGGLLKKVENGGCFFVKKSGPFLNAGCIMYYVQHQ